ncbi:hypothetical protein L6452_34750 [Arctium lappa]|uniref:Uncharacterized protein n=1 Tax=Arctium lappa TaxID=4217 RepID=A0ACB8YJ24_ARCLA|nr:hypothetical protein L6452_34750 [Arctium lappa]
MENLTESSSTLVSKVPMLKPSEFDMWKIRIKQYILLTDYSMWDIIENGPSEAGRIGPDGKRPPPKTDGERKIRQTEMKALSTLLLAIPNEYQHQFCNCTDAQILWNALEKRFAGTKSIKRNQRDVLKQQYENFTSSKNESMTQTFDRFNKLIGELATVGVKMDQDDINRKFLRSLGDEWTMYTVSYRQSDNLEEKELDDLYNDLRVFETEVDIKKKPTGYVHNSALLSAATDTTAIPEAVSTASGASSEKGTETIFEAFLSSHSNNSLINDDLDQLHPDDLEEMDIKWQMAMLSMRVKKFIKRTRRNNFSQRREDGAGFDKTKVECYKCHMKGHFARECWSAVPNNNHQQAQNGGYTQNKNPAQALVSQQGMGFDWSDQAEEAIQNQALMAEVSDLPSEVISNLCTKSCIDTVKRYRDHNQSMCDDLKRLEKDRRDYVLIVERFEEQIKGFQANELQHSYNTNYWKWEKNELETKLSKSLEESDRLKEELSKVKLDIGKFSYASKAMDSLLKAQIHDKMKPGIGYNSTPPPYNNNYISPTSDLLETKEKKDLSEKAFKIDPLDEVVIKDLTEKEASEDKDNDVSKEIPLENNIITNEGCGKIWIKSKEIEKTKGKDNKVHYKQTTVVNPGSCKQCDCSKAKSLNSSLKRGNQRNWNNQWAQKQGVDLSKINRPKPCFICGKLNHLAKYCFFNPINQQMTFQRFVQKPVGNRKAVKKQGEKKGPMKNKILKESIKMWVPKSTKTVSTADRVSAAGSITAATCVSTAENINAANTVSTSSKVNTPNTVTTANKVSTAKHASTAKAISNSKTSTVSSTNVSKPIIVTKYSKNEELKFKNLGNQQLKGRSIWHVDSGCSRHMTGNMSCLQDFKHINGGHVAFGDNLTGGSGCGGSGTSQVQESISRSVIFPIPTVNSFEDCEKEPSTGPSQSEEESRDEVTQENKESEVDTKNPSIELNDSNLEAGLNEEPSHNTRVQKNHPPQLVIRDISSPMMTRHQSRLQEMHDQQHTVLSCFLSQLEPKKAHDAMKESSWIEAMQEELLQFKLQDRDERGIVIRNKARLVAQGYTQEEGIDYEEVFAPVARIEAIRLFLAYASYMNFKVYQMDVKSAFLYGSIEEEVYVCQPPGFENPSYPDRVYKLKKALYGLHQAPRAWYDTLSSYLLENGFERGIIDKTLFIKRKKKDILLVQIYVDDIIFGSTRDNMCKEFEDLMHQRFKMSSMGELTFFLGLQVQQKSDGIFICQSKYVQDILTKFGFSDSKPASTPMETHKQITTDLEGEDMDVHHYRSIIGSLMYLTASRPDIMFPVCVCARFQVRPKQSHFQAVKRIFRYLKGQPRLGLWYPHDSPFDLIAYSDSDLGGANLDRKSTSGGCQFLGARLVSWQCKKQTTVSTSTTEAEYIAAASCCAQVLWIQNQMLDYGVTFLHTPIFIDNSSAISIVNNPVKHSKTKHIEIRYHFIRDCNEKKLVQVVKVHTDNQFADLFTKAFDVGRFTFLVTSVGMINSE